MKKILTLLISGLMITSSFAQYNPKEDWNSRDREDGFKGDDKGTKDKLDKYGRRMTYYFSSREKDMQIAQINRNYDFKMRSVQNRYFMSRNEKKRLIRQLQSQREYDIKEVMDRFYSKRNVFTNPRYRGYDKW